MSTEQIHTSPPGNHEDMRMFLAGCILAGDGMEYSTFKNEWHAWEACDWEKHLAIRYRRIPKPAPTVRYPARDLPKPTKVSAGVLASTSSVLQIFIYCATPADAEAHKAAVLEMANGGGK